MNTKKTQLEFETQQSNLLKLLAHPVRIAILQILKHEEACVCHLEATLGYRQAYLSQQLAVLRESGIVIDRRDGWNVYYQIQDQKILELLDLSATLIDQGQSMIPNTPVSCPCPKCNTQQQFETLGDQHKKEN
jgi:ArsR family transcriptional regulator